MLREGDLTVSSPQESALIAGVYTVELTAFGDERGRFTEVFRKEWFPQRDWGRLQWSRSESRQGVLRGLHYHRAQVDYWHCAAGRLRVGLVDVRRSSPTRGNRQLLDLDQERLSAVYVPVGVAHGFYALTDAMLLYLVDNYYDGSDELGVAWDDPALGLDWALPAAPVLSDRDRRNPLLAEVPEERLPG